MPVKIDVVTQADTGPVADLGRTLDDVAASGESLGQKVEAGLKAAEDQARPTKSEFASLARELQALADETGTDLPTALGRFKAAAEEAGLELRDGTLDALERIAARGPSEIDKVTSSLKDLRSAARSAGDGVGGLDKDLDKAGEGLRGIKDEAADTGREVAASFDGSSASVAEGFQEVVANAGAAFGPAGLIAGIVGAGALGWLSAAFQEEADKSSEAIEGMFQDMLESQNNYLSDQYVLEQIEKIAAGAEDAIASYDDLAAVAAARGETVATVTEQFVRGTLDWDEALSDVGDRINQNGGLLTAEGQILNKTNSDAVDALRRRRDQIEQNSDRMSRFNELGGRDLKKEIEVTDNGSASRTQSRINGIDGRDVPVQVRAYLESANRDVANWRAATSALPVGIQIRAYGQAAV